MIRFREIESKKEESDALRLAFSQYEKIGISSCPVCYKKEYCRYGEECQKERKTKWHISSKNTILVAVNENEIISTATIIFDGVEKLPTDISFDFYVNELRKKYRLAEVSCLASISNKIFPFFVQWVLHYGFSNRIAECFVGCTHPHHLDFWVKICGGIPVKREGSLDYVSNKAGVFGYFLSENFYKLSQRYNKYI